MDATLALTLLEAVLILVATAISQVIRLISPLDDSCKDTVDDSIPTVSSVSSHVIVAPPAKTKYDIFLSFRGEDTRDNFSSHLYDALRHANIHTFMDDKLHKGDNISPILLKTIQESEISLIIFSQDYASSTWCMDELVHIMKCMDQHGRIVVPIFYNVDPSSIRKQNGSFGDGFAKLKQRFKHNQERVQEWKNALIRSTNLSGWNSKNFRPESQLVKKIVKDVKSKLNSKSSFDLEGLVGVDHQIQKMEELLSEARTRILGIWGMGGIGKTTLVRVVFDKLKAQFEAFSFVENVRKELERIGLDELQGKCIKELLKDEDINTYNLRSTFVKNRLRRKKILLVLDDVDNSIAIEDLIKACGWFGEGSRIIITSRDNQVLKNASASSTYHVQKLEFSHALNLFSLKAFKQKPSQSYWELSERAVDYCEGNPLALKVLGCFFQGRGKEEWESALEKLNQTLHKDIFNVLKLSFDGLDDTQKNVFLDLAFFLNAEACWISLDCLRSLYGSSTHIEISVLKERSLISVHENGYFGMHGLLLEMGLEISRQQLISNPEKPIRLWRHDDIYHVFNNDKGIELIRCMSLDASKMKRITLRVNNFRKMHSLMFLIVYKSDRGKPSKLSVCEDLDYLSEELRFISWEEYPLPYVPLHFCAENLVILHMPNSNIRQLWNGNQYFPNLKEIDLSYSKDLIALPDLAHAPKIEHMFLDGCVSLARIHSSSNVPRRNVLFVIEDSGPVKINIGGSIIKGTSSSSGLVIVHNYLDLRNLSFHKVTMKVWACGNIISGVGYKHVIMPLAEETEELSKGIQSLASLLPFVSKLHWLESPIEIGHDFNQHFTYDHHYHPYYRRLYTGFTVVKVRGDTGEMINDDQAATTATTATFMEVEEEEEEEDELMESYCCRNTDSNILTRVVPYSIVRWSLLTDLTLQERDIIGNAGCSIAEVSILRSLIALSHDDDYSRRIEPHIDAKLSLDIPTTSPGGNSFRFRYTYIFRDILFRCNVITYGPLDYHLVVDYLLM